MATTPRRLAVTDDLTQTECLAAMELGEAAAWQRIAEDQNRATVGELATALKELSGIVRDVQIEQRDMLGEIKGYLKELSHQDGRVTSCETRLAQCSEKIAALEVSKARQEGGMGALKQTWILVLGAAGFIVGLLTLLERIAQH